MFGWRVAATARSATVALLALAVHPGFAQVPGGALPGQVDRPFEPRTTPRPAPPIELRIGPRQAAAAASMDATRFFISRIVLDGASAIPIDSLQPLLEAGSNREVSLAELYELADRLTAQLRNQGYVLSRVAVPEQRVSDGVVRLTLIEGYVRRVQVRGDKLAREALLQAHADRIAASRPLRADVLERSLLLMNDLAGSSAQATLVPAPGEPGAAELIIDFSSRSHEAQAEINRRGSRAVGPVRLEGQLGLHGPLQAFDDWRLSLTTTPDEELRSLALDVDVPLGTNGLTAGVGASVARARPDVGGPQVETRSTAAQLRLQYPVLRSRSENFYLRATLGWLDGRTDVADLRLSTDHIRTLRLGFSYDLTDRFLGVNFLDVQAIQGLDIGGATQRDDPESSRPGASPRLQKIALYAARLQSLAPRWELLAAFNGQYSGKKLFPSEQFAFGGETFGRAYDAGELLGDSGAALKLELRYSGNGTGALRGYTAYGFYEIGSIHRVDAADADPSFSAADAGAGLRFNLLDNLSGYLEFAKPLTRKVQLAGNRRVRYFAALRWTF